VSERVEILRRLADLAVAAGLRELADPGR